MGFRAYDAALLLKRVLGIQTQVLILVKNFYSLSLLPTNLLSILDSQMGFTHPKHLLEHAHLQVAVTGWGDDLVRKVLAVQAGNLISLEPMC